MSESRTKKTKTNIVFSYMDSILTLVFQFVSRTLIVQVLGSEYLGLSSLFQAILQVLNMAELGFSGAIVFNMYKPIAEGDTKTVCALLNYYKKVYNTVAIVVFVVGISVSPFLPYLIKGDLPPSMSIYFLYFLYLGNTCASYLFIAYKTALLNALQRLDLSKIAYIIANLIQYTLQIVSLIVFENYYLFVLGLILGTICKNLFSAYIANKKFPQYVCKGCLEQDKKKDIISRVKGLTVCNISGATYTTFDSIILSSFVGLTSVAVYNNYITIYAGITLFVTLIRNAMQASVGNSVAVETKEKNYKDMLLWQFLFSVIATWCVTCMASLYQPFMLFWMGDGLLLPFHDVALICVLFFLGVIQNSYFLYLSGNGLWWEMRWVYILSAVVNLILNVVLGKLIGITGIILSTLISTTLFGLIWQCSIVFKCYFGKSTQQFYFRQVGYVIVCTISCVGAYLLNSTLTITGVPGLFVRLVICTFVSVFVQLLVYFKTDEFLHAYKFIKSVLERW